MRRISLFLPLYLVIFFCAFLTASAADTDNEAREVALTLSVNGEAARVYATDGNVKTIVDLDAPSVLNVSAETPFAGLYLIWDRPPGAWTLTTDAQAIACGQCGFLHEYVALESPATSAALTLPDGAAICDIYAYSEGTLPEHVQVWSPVLEKADMLVLATHADDEILFMGGVLATYAGTGRCDAQVAYMVDHYSELPAREHEKLDGLWTIGVRHYPVTGLFQGYSSEPYESVAAFAVETIRRFQPLVVVTHDLNGEYGHARHAALARAVADAVDYGMDEDYYPASAETYGVWDVKKTYLHLYPKRQVTLDLRAPLPEFDGQCAIDVAKEAYLKHVSQQIWWFYITDDPDDPHGAELNCALFGLYRTRVGADTANDLLDHIAPYAIERRLAPYTFTPLSEKRRRGWEKALGL